MVGHVDLKERLQRDDPRLTPNSHRGPPFPGALWLRTRSLDVADKDIDGLHGHAGLVPWIWTAIALDVLGLLLLITPLSRRITGLNVACVACFVGIWIEKGMGLIIPGFVPSPLGQVVEYLPTLNETLVCLGIWAFGMLLYSWMLHVAIPIMNGSLRANPQLATNEK